MTVTAVTVTARLQDWGVDTMVGIRGTMVGARSRVRHAALHDPIATREILGPPAARRRSITPTLLGMQSRFGHEVLGIRVLCPQSGTAVMKGAIYI